MFSGTVARSTARMLERRRVTRAGVTRISLLAAVAAAVWFSRPDAVGGVAGSLCLGAVLFCDAVRARMRANRRDALTVWLASMVSQLREHVVYVGLAIGGLLAGVHDVWGWAAGALIALALRDSLLAARAAPAPAIAPPRAGLVPRARRERSGGLLAGLAPRQIDPRPAGHLPGAGAAPGAAPAPGANAAPAPPGPTAPPRSAVASPARRVMVFSQATRFLAIAVTATLWDARVAFLTLIVGCVLAVTSELADPRGARR